MLLIGFLIFWVAVARGVLSLSDSKASGKLEDECFAIFQVLRSVYRFSLFSQTDIKPTSWMSDGLSSSDAISRL